MWVIERVVVRLLRGEVPVVELQVMCVEGTEEALAAYAERQGSASGDPFCPIYRLFLGFFGAPDSPPV